MTSVHYVTDESGTPVAVQISIQDWKLIKAELEPYDGETETAEILADSEFTDFLSRGREQTKRRLGKPLAEVSV